MHHKELTYTHKDLTFTIRGMATRGDQYEMHAIMGEGVQIKDGKVIKVSSLKLYPWLIERFVTGWSEKTPFSMQALMGQPADPGEDLIIILGSFILNHTGIAVTQEMAEVKNA